MKYLLLFFCIFLSSISKASNYDQTFWTGSAGCLATIYVQGNNISSTIASVESLLGRTLARHPMARMYNIDGGSIHMLSSTVSTSNIHHSQQSCTTELTTKCTVWGEQLESQLGTLATTGLANVVSLQIAGTMSFKDPTGSGCWPIDGEEDETFQPKPSIDPSKDFDVQNNFVVVPSELDYAVIPGMSLAEIKAIPNNVILKAMQEQIILAQDNNIMLTRNEYFTDHHWMIFTPHGAEQIYEHIIDKNINFNFGGKLSDVKVLRHIANIGNINHPQGFRNIQIQQTHGNGFSFVFRGAKNLLGLLFMSTSPDHISRIQNDPSQLYVYYGKQKNGDTNQYCEQALSDINVKKKVLMFLYALAKANNCI
ncbi:MAG TPA: hypothetical protein PKC21_01375 [Oligoflexia bacterium]|nr:hypothetical protein [Oligoflexia bacterium]HMR23981.1 hypothetical protein [Oligoflexia bacterium]